MMKRLFYIGISAVTLLTGCRKEFFDINTDPNNPTSISLSRLLPTAEQATAYGLGFTNDNRGARGLTEVLSVYTHQVTVREDQDQYGADGSEFNINGAWKIIYSAEQGQTPNTDIIGCLQNLEIIIRQGTEQDNLIYVGIAKILKAYMMSQLVDVFADVPFSEANQFDAEVSIRYPKYDKGADIYPQLLTMLDEGIADLEVDAGNVLVPGDDDLIYGGDVDLWRKTAKTIKFKLYNQLRLVQDVSTEVAALLAEDDMISSWEESFIFNYGPTSSPDDRNPGFSEYFATQKSHYQSPWFYETLKGYHSNILSGIEDPRIPYYFYNQLEADEPAQANTDYRDGAFVSILFGSRGPDRDRSQDNSMTVFGIYPVGGRYDDGGAIAVDAGSATGAAPLRILTYADRLFIEAELIHAGVITGDARQVLSDAIDASFDQVNQVVELAKGSQTVPPISGDDIDTYRDAVLSEYDSKPAAGKLEMIMTQKWIQSFGFSLDQYTDYRRTGYPVLFNPNDASQAPGGFYQPPVNADPMRPGAQPAVRVQVSRNYPVSLPWSVDDLNVNPNAPTQKQPDTFKVFWDN